jgi:hypothetical protein
MKKKLGNTNERDEESTVYAAGLAVLASYLAGCEEG